MFAGEPYDTGLEDLGNLNAHLTNTCRLEGGGGIEEEHVVRLLSELPVVSDRPNLHSQLGYCATHVTQHSLSPTNPRSSVIYALL